MFLKRAYSNSKVLEFYRKKEKSEEKSQTWTCTAELSPKDSTAVRIARTLPRVGEFKYIGNMINQPNQSRQVKETGKRKKV